MSLFDKKGISLAAGFDYQAEQPLDSRFNVVNKQELQKLIDGKAVYNGLITFCLEDNKLYIFDGNAFVEFQQNSSADIANLNQKVNNIETELNKINWKQEVIDLK